MKKEVEKKKFSLTPFSIILILLALLALITHFLPSADFDKNGELVSGSGVVAASLSDFLMAPVNGFAGAVEVCIFVLILGGFLAMVTKTGALETGIKVLVKKLKVE